MRCWRGHLRHPWSSSARRPAIYRIAIVDDDISICTILSNVLSDEGYEVVVATGPDELLAQVLRLPPDLALIDMCLGSWGDGLTLAAAMRSEPLLAHTRLILMSGAADWLRQHSSELRHLQAHMVAKPFDLDELLALIARELG